MAATFTAMVLLPTPPLQLLTAIIFLIPNKFPFLTYLSFYYLGARVISTSEKPADTKCYLRMDLIFL